MGERADGEIAFPFVAAVAGNGDEPAPVRPQRGDAYGLVADVAGAVRPHHIFGGDAAVAARILELLPTVRLVDAQAGEVGSGAGLAPGGAHGIGLVVRLVLVDHRAMARVFQLDRHRRLSLDWDGFADDRHDFPYAAVAVLVGIGGVGVVNVEVFAVGAEDGEAPGAEIVVADGDARQRGLAAADDVPPGRDQVHPVAQRGRLLHAVRVVHHHGEAAGGEFPADDPVVAADVLLPGAQIKRRGRGGARQLGCRSGIAVCGRQFIGREVNGLAEGVVHRKNVLREQRGLDGGIEAQVRIGRLEVVQVFDPGGPDGANGQRHVELLVHIRQQTVEARDDHGGSPLARLEAEQAEFGRQ